MYARESQHCNSNAFARGEETCMRIEAHSMQDNTAVKRIRQRRGNVYARESPICQLRRISRKRKRVCTRRPTRHLETCMHEKANTSIEAHSLEARNRVCTRKPTRQSRRMRLRRGNVYARESQHFGQGAIHSNRKRVCTRSHKAKKRVRLEEETCMRGKANTSFRACSLGRETVYARESHHINSNAVRPGE